MPYWRLFYHLVWGTKNRHRWITEAAEPILYDFIRAKAIGLGATVFALNGIEDHVHLVAAIPPRIAVGTFVGQVKGIASSKYNKLQPDASHHFAWQEEYGAFSFDGKRLPNIIAYVEDQKRHHAQQTTIPALERVDGESSYIMRESSVLYRTDDQGWRAEMESLD